MKTTPQGLFDSIFKERKVDNLLKLCDQSLQEKILTVNIPKDYGTDVIQEVYDHLIALGFIVSWQLTTLYSKFEFALGVQTVKSNSSKNQMYPGLNGQVRQS